MTITRLADDRFYALSAAAAELRDQDLLTQSLFPGEPVHIANVTEQRGFLGRWLPEVQRDNRNYLTVAIGCTGGRHRSVMIAERMRRALVDTGGRVRVRHRDITRS
jgi:UPF0042 nucleotide-binding protein